MDGIRLRQMSISTDNDDISITRKMTALFRYWKKKMTGHLPFLILPEASIKENGMNGMAGYI